MAAINLPKHGKRLRARATRLAREIASKQRQYAATLTLIAKLRASLDDPTDAAAAPPLPETWKPFVVPAKGGAL